MKLGSESHRRAGWREWGWGALLVILVGAAYVPVYWAGWIWDDDQYITRNMALRTARGLARIWMQPSASPQYYPMTMTTFWLEYHLWGLNSALYHLDNCVLHAANCVLLWLILIRLEVKGAWLIAAIWGVHPVNVESVAWATERKNILSGFFYLWAFWAYWKFSSNLTRRWRWYALALCLFVMALLSKSVTSTLPAAVLLVLWWKKGRIQLREILELLPFFVMGACMGIATSFIEKYHVGAEGKEFLFNWVERCWIAGHAVWFYAAKDIFPWRLSFVYRQWPLWMGQWGYVAGVIALAAILAGLRGKTGRGPLVAWLYFVGTLFPALGFINVYPMKYSFVADHFQYLASIGMIGLVVGSAADLMDNGSDKKAWVNKNGKWICGGVLLFLFVVTWMRAVVMADQESVWRDTIAKNPDAWMARTNLGILLLYRASEEQRTGENAKAVADLNEAEQEFQATRALKPDSIEPLMDIGKIRELLGDYKGAEEWTKRAVDLDPASAESHFHFGMALIEAGKTEQGIAEYKRTIEINPKHEAAMVNLGSVYFDQRNYEQAKSLYRKALEVDGDSIYALTNLGNVLRKQGEWDQAIKEYEKALRLEPDFEAAVSGLEKTRRKDMQ